MATPVDDRQISLEEVKAAAASRDLPALVGRLVRERSWGSLTVLFHYAGSEGTPSAANSRSGHAVSQYDIACFRGPKR